MQRKTFHRFLLASGAALAMGWGPAHAQSAEFSFFYPVAVGGPITKVIDGFATDFMKANPGIKVNPIYAGIDEDAIVPIDNFVKTADDKAWLDGFHQAFMMNSRAGGKTWGVPFQRSTVVMYYNKELFKEAGLDPNKPPSNWAELKAAATRLTKKDASGKTSQWGIQIPSSGFPYWLFQTLTTPNGVELANEGGNQVNFNDPKVVEALQYWVDLGKAGVHPPGVVEWGTTPKDFFEKKTAIMFTTTGNLTNVKSNAKFDFGVAMIPGNKLKGGSPTGGGNFYIFKKAKPEQQEAAFKFIKWVTQPERAAQWSIDTGYVAVSRAAYDTPALKKYGQEFPPALVARDQLPVSVAELSTHDNQRVTKALNDGLQAALTGTKTPKQAMDDAQREAERLLRSYK